MYARNGAKHKCDLRSDDRPDCIARRLGHRKAERRLVST